MAFELISDLHKDARGTRPTMDWMQAFTESTYEEQEAIWESLCDELEQREAERRADEADALAVFERRLEDMQADYGIDLATALRWDMDAFEVDIAGAIETFGDATQEIEFYLWKQGIAFDQYQRFVKIIKDAVDLREAV